MILSVVRIMIVGFALLTATSPCWSSPTHHELEVRLDPAAYRIAVVDRISVGRDVALDADGTFHLVLHAGLAPEVTTPGWRLEAVDGSVEATFFGINATTDTVAENVPLEAWRLRRAQDASGPVEIRYGGVIHHALQTQGEEYQRSFSETPGIISPRGSSSPAPASGCRPSATAWSPSSSRSASSTRPGTRSARAAVPGTRSPPPATGSPPGPLEDPTEEIYLVAGPWQAYADRAGDVELYAFLREDDPGLADRYLDATKRYLKLYDGMLPPYPYPSFALVENFWETGYGMPGFTLLGPQVIRFPWILTSSYPHELLHNWWGNSVYVDVRRPATGARGSPPTWPTTSSPSSAARARATAAPR